LDTLLETNAILLRKGAAKRREFPGVTIHDPVLIDDGVSIEGASVIGPNVTLEAGTRVIDSTLRHTIVGRNARLTGATLEHSMLGDNVIADGLRGRASLGDHSEIVAKGA
jgi:glucose-1-phosphate thymidylyltransferase